MNNENETPTRRPKQYGFQPSPYADKKPVTMRLSREARDLLDAEARNANTSVTELVEQIVRQRILTIPGGEKLGVVDLPVDKGETQRSLDSARAEIARLVAELDTTRDKWKAATDSLEVYSNDAARFLSRAEAAEDELAKLQDVVQAAPIMENPQSLKLQLDTANARIEQLNSIMRDASFPKPLRGFKEIVADMPDKTRGKWDADKWKAETWVKYFLDNK